MKKHLGVIGVLLWIITLIFSFYAGVKYYESRGDAVAVIVEVPIEDVEAQAAKNRGITSEEAEELCYDVLPDKDDMTGFPISYQCTGAVAAGDKQYYVMHISWFVDDSHWSYIGNCFVSSDGTQIYDGVASNGEYVMTGIRWER